MLELINDSHESAPVHAWALKLSCCNNFALACCKTLAGFRTVLLAKALISAYRVPVAQQKWSTSALHLSQLHSEQRARGTPTGLHNKA